MRYLVIGLGSMGKRRIRCLKKLGYNNIIGFDIREDRMNEAKKLYDIEIIKNMESVKEIDVVIISTPPDKHIEYALWAIENSYPVFIEASVILEHSIKIREFLIKNKKEDAIICPSCTLKFHPVIKDIKNIVQSGKWGKLSNFSYHSGQYLPEWHPWENIKDYYVSKKATGGAREIVPFELTWLCDIFGYPESVKGFFGKTIDLDCDIDDTYVVSLKFKEGFGSLLVDVVSRFATRKLTLNLEYAQISWDWNERLLKLYDAKNKRFINIEQPSGENIAGYNVNIIEDMYIEEIEHFIGHIKKEKKFPNTLDNDIKILEILKEIEIS
ncbi:gfo/Idh/MocA family oxidoreductase [hot springs metagenome]|uniref:Gfo/Idh/MocA family oxidoreductase n=1 Tax=hot springs metagenome TaxID=433727 RepID=A0A5J4KYC3_9ZZZZ